MGSVCYLVWCFMGGVFVVYVVWFVIFVVC